MKPARHYLAMFFASLSFSMICRPNHLARHSLDEQMTNDGVKDCPGVSRGPEAQLAPVCIVS